MAKPNETTTVPAQPGFDVIGLCGNGSIFTMPIIAWVVTTCFDEENGEVQFTIVRPVTISSETRDMAIKLPDGRVEVQDDSIFDDVEAWVNSLTIHMR